MLINLFDNKIITVFPFKEKKQKKKALCYKT